jgi:hypothetical protein
MSPERAHGEAPTAASDLWSLGATLWTAAEGRPPFEGPTGLATMTAVATEPPPRCARCAGPLGDLLHRMMDRDPAARPALADVRRELAALADTAPRRPVASDPYPTEPLPVAFDRTTALEPIGDRPAAAARPPAAAPVRPAAPPRPAVVPARSKRGLGWLVAALVGLVALAAILAAVTLGGSGGPGTSADKSSPPSSKATAKSSSASGGSSAALPAGWHRFSNSSLGWSIGIPPGWQVDDSGDTATFTDPAGGRYVRVDTRYPAGPSAIGAWQDQERAFRGSHPGYQRVRLETVHYGSYRDSADWEFTYQSGAVTLHALDHAFITDGNRGYAIYFQTHDDQWSSSNDLLQGFLSSFRPGSR